MLIQNKQYTGSEMYRFRAFEVPTLLDELGTNLPESVSKDSILWQCLVDVVLKARLDDAISSCSKNVKDYTHVEENAIQYAAGYILKKSIAKMMI